MTDSQTLLADYARTGSDAAFRELVGRYVDLVYSTALRLVEGDRHRAEDVAQIVFVDLARAARTLSHEVKLGGWLHRHTCFVAAKTMRGERRRQSRERQTVEMNALQDNSGGNFALMAPILDEAINELGEADRTAILLRFYEQREFRSVGAAIGTTEDAARMRVTRALEKLQDLLLRRGVKASAATLSIALSAHAVQAAPVGLAVTISTASALAATAAQTSTAIAAAKTIAMTTLQKSLIAATLTLAVGTGLYEARQASVLQTQVQTLQQQADQIQQAQRERDDAISALTAAQVQIGQLGQEVGENLRLRAEVARLRSEAQAVTRSQPGNASSPTESTAMTWANRVARLKQHLEQVPQARIPEMQLLDEEDWLAVVKGRPLDTDIEYRRALSALRIAGEGKLASLMQKALRGFGRSNNGQFPTDLAQLQPYFDSPVDAAILDRWQIAPGDTVPSVGVGDIIVTQKGPPIDEVFDARLVLGSGGGQGSTDFLLPETREAMEPVFQAYRAAHNGQWQTDLSELQPYATTPEQQAALQKMILRNPASK